MIFDSHAHYDDGQFDPDREELLGHILPERGVCGVINMGADLQGCYDTVALTERYGYFYGGAGIHPENARDLPEDWLETVTGLLQKERIVAVGEIGLDYHWLDECPKNRQLEVFERQLALAKELDMPVSVHDREAHGDTLALLKKYRPRGVVHCFSGSVEMAQELLKLGMYLGFGGVVTFKNAKHPVEVAKSIPLERLLLETDAPYMAPVPCRGKRNDSSLIPHVANRIAELRGEKPETILNAGVENAHRLFAIPEQEDFPAPY